MIIPEEGRGCVCVRVWLKGVCMCEKSSPQTGLYNYMSICTRSVPGKLYPHLRHAGQSLSVISSACVCWAASRLFELINLSDSAM